MKTAILENHDLNAITWCKLFTREELRDIAKEHGIRCGRNKNDTAHNLCRGCPVKRAVGVITFYIDLSIRNAK